MKFKKKAFGDAVSTMILFIAIISVTTGLVVLFNNYVSETQDSFSTQNKITTSKLRTSLSITNVDYNSSSQELKIYVKNIGESKLYTKNFDIYLEGAFKNNFSVYYADNLSNQMQVLIPQYTGAFIINESLTAGTYEVNVVSEFGVGSKETFNI